MPDQNSSVDIPNSSQTTAQLPALGDATAIGIFSTIDFASDRDWFGVDLTAGVSYWFRLDSASYLDPELIGPGQGVASPDVSVFIPASGYAPEPDTASGADFSVMRFTPATSGRYFVEAAGGFFQTGKYALNYGRTSSVALPQVDFNNLAGSGLGLPAGDNLQLEMTSLVRRGTGTAVLYEGSGASRIFVADFNASAPAASNRGTVTLNFGTVTLDPPSPLKADTEYTLELRAGFVTNVLNQGNATQSLVFRTAPDGGPGSPTPAGQSFIGDAGNNPFTGTAGNDNYEGLGGIDTVTFAGQRAQYALSRAGNYWFVDDGVAARDGSDQLHGIERLHFADRKLALDLAIGQSAGNTALFLGVLAPALLPSPAVVGAVMGFFDQGATLGGLFQTALDTGLVAALANGADFPSAARLVVRNVLNVPEAPEVVVDAVLAFWDGRLASLPPAVILETIAQLPVTIERVGLGTLQQTGLEFA